MTNKVTFETATLADAVTKAVAVAPSKGSALDRSGGIVIELNKYPGEPCVIRSTDMEVTFRMSVAVVEITPDEATWRLGLGLFPKLIAQLPVESGSKVKLLDNDKRELIITAGKTKAKTRMIDPDLPFPEWEPFKEGSLVEASDFAARLRQVAWATDGRSPGDPLSGVHIDGAHLVGTDRKAIAFVPCAVPLPAPVTAPLHSLAALMRNADVVGIEATADKLLLVPGTGIQLTSTLILTPFPDFKRLMDPAMLDQSIKVGRDDLSAALGRMMILAGEDRKIPAMNLTFDADSVTMMMDLPEVGKIEEKFDGVGGNVDSQTVIQNPKTLKHAIDASNFEVITIRYHLTNQRMPLRVEDDSGYFAVLQGFDPSQR